MVRPYLEQELSVLEGRIRFVNSEMEKLEDVTGDGGTRAAIVSGSHMRLLAPRGVGRGGLTDVFA